jgi:hypothetical protein
MTRLPQPGSDSGQWGQILNDFLSQSHTADGSLKSASVTGPTVQDGSLTIAKTANLQVTLDNKVATSGPASTSGAVFWGVWSAGNDPTPPNDGKVHWGFRVVE